MNLVFKQKFNHLYASHFTSLRTIIKYIVHTSSNIFWNYDHIAIKNRKSKLRNKELTVFQIELFPE